MQAKAYLPLFKEAFNEWSEDKASRLAAALAYYTAVSIAPLLVLAVTILGWLSFDGRAVVEDQMAMLMGSTGKEAATTMIDAAKKSSGVIPTIISLVILIFGASGVFGELQDSLNTIWEVQPDPKAGIWDTIKKRFFSMTMVFGVIFLLLVSMVISTVLGAMVTRFASEGGKVGLIVDTLFSLAIYTGIFALLFKHLPDVKIRYRDVWVGAVFTAVLFAIGKYLLTLYLTKGSTASAYGAAGSLAALLIWVYYAAQILFFGAEFTRVYATKFGGYHPPERGAVPMTEEQRAQRGIVREHDLQVAKEAETSRASQRGAPYPGRSPVPDRRVVTITRPTPDAQKAYAFAGMGLAAGFIVGAIGMLKGRKYTADGIKQIALNQRLSEIESRLQGRSPDVVATAIRVEERLDELDARVRGATTAVQRRRREAARREHPTTFTERFDAALKARKGQPNIIERLTGVSTKPTFVERLGEMIGK
ncbi:MAG: rane protein [Phycisphaerales bacterium]|jgi:membrane protein|nr:rane protein [Phycisphaerales bacterium]